MVGVRVTKELFARVLDEEMVRIEREVGPAKFASSRYREAAKLFAKQCTSEILDDFLTLDAYRNIVQFAPTARM
jgi:malate synthase